MSLKVSRILHAGYLLEHQGTIIIFDPIFENPFSRNCYAFPDVIFDRVKIQELEISAVFISHYHDDHLSFDSLHLINKKTPIFLFCIHEEMFDLIRELGFTNVIPLKLNTTVKIDNFNVTPLKSLDEDVDSLFQIQVDGLNILNVVDSWIGPDTMDDLKLKSPWDLILWPFQTMREIEVISPRLSAQSPPELPVEWIEQIKELNPKYLVPSSCQFIHEPWSWYNNSFFPISYSKFSDEVRKILPSTNVIRMNPSSTFEFESGSVKRAHSLSWMEPKGLQDVDYHYIADLIPPTTAEISKNFPSLSSEEKKVVFDFCQNGILGKFQNLEPSDDRYFSSKIFWKLSIYDHLGNENYFYYEIIKNKIVLLKNSPEEISWFTEVPMTKLYAALMNGESLTSMYMRINDMRFLEKVSKELLEVDILEDPLCRCLFSQSFGAYQKAQLQKILSLQIRS